MSLISISMLLSHKDVTKGLRQLQKWVLYSQGESNIPQDMNTPSSNWREQSSEETSSNPIKRKQNHDPCRILHRIYWFLVPQLFISNNNILHMVFYNILTLQIWKLHVPFQWSMGTHKHSLSHPSTITPINIFNPPSLLLFAWIPKQTELGSKWSRCFYQSQ